MRVLVTGGAGFIGSNFIRYLLATHPDYLVRNFDLLTYAGNTQSLSDVASDRRYEFIKGDIADPVAVQEAMSGCDLVVNFAAESHVDRSIIDSSVFVRTNVVGVQVLLDAARDAGIARFLQVSTDEVYGSREEGSASESDALAPNSPYAASKASGDLLARSYFVTHKLPVLITRSTNNYGPYQFPEKLIPLFITRFLAGKEVPLYGDGGNVRDWLFVEDNCRALDVVLHAGIPGEIYNIAAANEMANTEVARTIVALCGADPGLIKHVPDRPGHDWRYSVLFEKVSRLGWVPVISFDAGLACTVAFYQERRDWWKSFQEETSYGVLPQ